MRLAPRLTVLGLALLLAGCGFHPLYAVPGKAHGYMRDQMQAIYVAPAPDRLGYEMRNQLIDLLDGTAEEKGASYRLNFTIAQKQEAIGVQSQKVGSLSQTTITRYNDRLTVVYELTDVKTRAVLTKGTETGLSSFNVMASPYATVVAQQNADKQSADDIADRIRIALAAFFAQKQ
jgi:LPS-assembly lipoprotein